MNRLKLGLIFSILSASSIAQVQNISDSECSDMKRNQVLSQNAPVSCERLSKVTFNFVNFKGETKKGDLIVLDIIAPQVEQIFAKLYQEKFPLHSAIPMERFNGDDDASMAANNSSAFIARPITGGANWSKHAYGVAIDINPVQNPFLEFGDDGKITVKPNESTLKYVNRSRFRARSEIQRSGMAEEVVDIFAHHGFLIWGGDWNYPINTQHFEIGSRKFIEQLSSAPKSDAIKAFSGYIDHYRTCFAKDTKVPAEHRRATCAYRTVTNFDFGDN